ncbi:MAG: radical SAM family heme chaperone HemW [Anaerolineales bacterium]
MKVGLYVHVPFCRRRCTYCDFNTYAGLLELRPQYVNALLQELELHAEYPASLEATTLYFGGGTPSLLPVESVTSLVEAARRLFRLNDAAEITLEANPGTVERTSLRRLREVGVNRLSLGVQSAAEGELALLGRIHGWEEACAAVEDARRAGFDNLSLDLIFGLPGQSLAGWARSLEAVLALAPRHLSLYALKLEPGTPLAERVGRGELPEPDPDLAADMYDLAGERLQAAGFWQYEISNWALGVQPSPTLWALPPQGRTEGLGPWVAHHNLIYWRNQPWLGLGAGAHSWLGGRRWSNLTRPREYGARLEAGRLPVVEEEPIPRSLEMGETLMMGLRLAEGVADVEFRARFGMGLEERYGTVIERFVRLGLLEWCAERLRLTVTGRLLGNQVFGAFLPDLGG